MRAPRESHPSARGTRHCWSIVQTSPSGLVAYQVDMASAVSGSVMTCSQTHISQPPSVQLHDRVLEGPVGVAGQHGHRGRPGRTPTGRRRRSRRSASGGCPASPRSRRCATRRRACGPAPGRSRESHTKSARSSSACGVKCTPSSALGDHHAEPPTVAHGAAQPVGQPHLAVGADGGARGAGPVAGTAAGRGDGHLGGVLAGHGDGERERVDGAGHGLSIVKWPRS